MILKSRIHTLSVLAGLLLLLVGIPARAVQPGFTAAGQDNAPPRASVETTAVLAGAPFTLMGFVYAPDGSAGDAATANSYAGLFAYRGGIADQIGHQNPPPNDIYDADGMGTPAYFFTDVGSSDWITPPAVGQDVVAVLETYEGFNGWTGPSYAASLDKVIELADIVGGGIELPVPVTMELIPTPQGITLTDSIILTWTGLADPAENVLHYTVYRSEDGGPYSEVGTSTPQIPGGTIYYTDTNVTADSCYSYTIAVNYRWGGEGGAPEYHTTAGRSNPPAGPFCLEPPTTPTITPTPSDTPTSTPTPTDTPTVTPTPTDTPTSTPTPTETPTITPTPTDTPTITPTPTSTPTATPTPTPTCCDYDFDNSGIIDVADIMEVASCWRSTDPECASYDLDGDGDIDIVDIMKVAACWGETCP